VFTYATHYFTQRYREHQIRQQVFKEAQVFGEQRISPLAKPRRLYVLLNPQASNGKCKALFQKNVAPIFQLAGIDITLIQTDYEGHAKTTVNYFDSQIDGVVVAGGDGTLQETVTGMFRQREEENIAMLPVGFIPLGRHGNSMYKKLFTQDDMYHVRSMCKATMAVVKGVCTETSVLEVQTESKPVYALHNIHFGAYEQVKQKVDAGKYWLLGPVKKHFAFLWRTLRHWPYPHTATLQCTGDGGNVSSTELLCDNFSVYLQEDILQDNTQDTQPLLLVQKQANDISRLDFIRHGWAWLEQKFSPTLSETTTEMLRCSEVCVTPHESDGESKETVSYGIDGEVFDARPITVRIDARKLKMFSDPDGG